jgi:acylphosphatase
MRTRLIVRGRVQGVGFRYATIERARQLGLAGWARNLPDGTVEIVAEGGAAEIEALTEWARRGPPGARVARVDATPAPDAALAGGFSMRH